MKSTNRLMTMSCMLLFAGSMFLTDCKKKEDPKEDPIADESGQSGTDSREAQAENEAAINDVNDVMSSNNKVSGKGVDGAKGTTGTICGLTVDSAQAGTGIMKLNYNGTTCNNRTRTGSIKLTLLNYSTGKRWKDLGATIKIEYLNYKITRASDQKSIMLNGEQQLTNVSGGTWLHLLFLGQPNLVSTVTGTNLTVTWQDNKTAVYNINRRFTYTWAGPPANVLTVKGEGIGSSNSLNDLENYGTTRDGDAFTSQVTTPIIWNTTCGGGAPLQGAVNIKVSSKNFDLKFLYGVDANGNSVSVGANQCPYGWKLEWTVNSTTKTKVLGYN